MRSSRGAGRVHGCERKKRRHGPLGDPPGRAAPPASARISTFDEQLPHETRPHRPESGRRTASSRRRCAPAREQQICARWRRRSKSSTELTAPRKIGQRRVACQRRLFERKISPILRSQKLPQRGAVRQVAERSCRALSRCILMVCRRQASSRSDHGNIMLFPGREAQRSASGSLHRPGTGGRHGMMPIDHTTHSVRLASRTRHDMSPHQSSFFPQRIAQHDGLRHGLAIVSVGRSARTPPGPPGRRRIPS